MINSRASLVLIALGALASSSSAAPVSLSGSDADSLSFVRRSSVQMGPEGMTITNADGSVTHLGDGGIHTTGGKNDGDNVVMGPNGMTIGDSDDDDNDDWTTSLLDHSASSTSTSAAQPSSTNKADLAKAASMAASSASAASASATSGSHKNAAGRSAPTYGPAVAVAGVVAGWMWIMV